MALVDEPGPEPLVAPFTGAWIEITPSIASNARSVVAPFTGAWIEILAVTGGTAERQSHPSRVRGLK